ncbi:MAG: hypothetical protein ACQES2_11755 [Pseudomonadota bacterium]
MRTFIRLLTIFSAALALVACADEGLNFNDSSTAASINGSATKGTLIGARVELYGFDQSGAFLLAESTTDASGDYELSVPDDYRGPAKLVVSAAPGGNTTMVCDAPAGCGSAAFGQTLPVSPNLELTAYQREVLPGQPVQLHATPYTHLAASLVDGNTVDAASIAAATRQVADLFQLPGDFSSIKPADVTQTGEVADASAAELRYSALIAAFAGGDGQDMANRLNDYTDSLAALGGQLAQTGANPDAPSLEQLYTSARSVADQLDSNLLRSEFDSRLASLEGGENSDADSDGSNAENYGELIAAALDDADRLEGMLSGNALDLYLDSQIDQLSWLFTEDLVPSLMVGVDVFKLVLVAALANDVALEYADSDGQLDMTSLVGDTGMSASYDINTQTLRYYTPDAPAGLGVDIKIDVTPVIDGILPAMEDGSLTYVLHEGSYLHNSSFKVDFVKNSNVTFKFAEQDDFSPAQIAFKMLMELGDPDELQQELASNPVVSSCFQEAANNPDISSGEEPLHAMDCVAGDFLQGLNASGELGFGVTLTKADGSQQFDIDFLGYGDVDLTNPAAPTLVNLEIRDGHLYAPNGDAIYTIGEEDGLVLNLGNSNNAMFARFGVESALVPTTEVTTSARFHDLQDYLDTFNGSPLAFDFNRLRIEMLVQQPLTTLVDFVGAITANGALVDFVDYLLAETTPRDFVDTLNVQLDVQADAQWPERRYQIDFQSDLLEVSNQDGVRFKYSAEPGAIVSHIAVDGSDLVEVRVTEDGVQIIDIEDAVTIDPEEIPSERIMALFARLDVLIDLDQQARDLLSQYGGAVSF